MKNNPYEEYDVPGNGEILPDGTYWTFISADEAEFIRNHGMKSSTGQECLEIRNIKDNIIARWEKNNRFPDT